MAHTLTQWSWQRETLALTVALMVNCLSGPPVGAGAQTDRERAGFVGPVRTVSTVGFSDAPFGQTERGRGVATYDPQGHVSESTIYFTRKAGDPFAEEDQAIPPPAKQVYTYAFEFDARGNWLKQTLFACEPACRQLSVMTRTLTYYAEGKK